MNQSLEVWILFAIATPATQLSLAQSQNSEQYGVLAFLTIKANKENHY